MQKPPRRIPTEQNFWNRNSKPSSQRKIKRLAELYELDLRSTTTLFNAHVDFDQPEKRPVDSGAIVPAAEIQHLIDTDCIPQPGQFTTDELVDWLLREKDNSDPQSIADAFVMGISNGRYDWRSALGSYASFYAFTRRNCQAAIKRGIEGLPAADQTADLNFVYFALRRLWKPYMLHDRVDYVAFDLSRFQLQDIPSPSKADTQQFRKLLDAIRKLPASAKLTDLQKSVTGIVKGDKYDRTHVLEILGFCDILGSPDHPPMRTHFLNQQQRPMPDHFYSRDWRYPVCFWNGEVGVNEEAVAGWFPGLEK